MTTWVPDGPTPDGVERDRSEDDTEQAAGAVPAAPPLADDAVPPKQIHRWKSEGGALHPDD